MTYEFHTRPAVRGTQPLIVAVIADHFGGKTMSALELATGIAEITGQRIVLADTEPPRGEQYASEYDYHYVDMGHGEYPPARFLALLDAFRDDILIVDSFSDEHEGPGGVTEMQLRIYEADRRPNVKEGTKNSQAWVQVKKERNTLTTAIQRHPSALILCIRAKPPSEMGKKFWTAKTDSRYLGPCTVSFFVNNGRIVWDGDEKGQLDDRLTHLVDGMPRACIGERLDKDTGRLLAQWARGEMPTHPLAERLDHAATEDDVRGVESEIRAVYRSLDQWSRRQLELAGAAARERVGMPTIKEERRLMEAKAT